MNRSRVTFAITEAAAIAALVASPPTTGRCSNPVGGTGNPSERQRQPSTPTRRSMSLSAARLVLCSPRSSMPRTHREVTATAVAARSTRGYRSSRASIECCLESLSARERAQVGQRQLLVVEQHRGGDQRPGEAAAAGLVGARHEAHAQPAVVTEEPRPDRARRARAARRRAGSSR